MVMCYPEVSIIVPIYNAEKYIEKCSRSLFEQTFQSIEYIFVDDCSPDASIDKIKNILNDYPHRQEQCVFIRLANNSGPATARNIGLKISRGQYIYFCDADDWVNNLLIEKFYNIAIYRQADIVVCDYYFVYNNKKIYYRAVDWTSEKVNSLREYIRKGYNVIWNLFVRSSVYKTNDINFIEGYTYGEDFNLSVKLIVKSVVIINLHEPLYYYNQTNTVSVTTKMSKKILYEEPIMCLNLMEWLKKENEYEHYADLLNWKVLNSKQEWLLSTKDFSKFTETVPESNKFILTCPYLNLKLKIMGWCLIHHLSFVTVLFLCLRHLKLYYIRIIKRGN